MQADRAIALSQAVTQTLQQERQQCEAKFRSTFRDRCAELDDCFEAIAHALQGSNAIATTVALSNLATELGHRLQFETFEEFDDFMDHSDIVLVL